MVRETRVQSQVASYQRLEKWYLIPPCLTLSIIMYVSKVKWRNPGKGVAPYLTLQCSSYRKGSLRVALDYGRQFYLLYLPFKNQLLDTEIRNYQRLVTSLSLSLSLSLCYLIPNPLYTYISSIYDLVWFGFMAYQRL